MSGADAKASEPPHWASSRRDAGVAFIELLVAIVLLGTAVVGVTAAVRATVIGSRLELDHSRAQVWLQSSIEALDALPRIGCDPVGDPPVTRDVRAEYEQAIRAVASPIDSWDPDAQLFVTSVLFWNGTTYQTMCADDAGFLLQLVKIVVRSPDGEIVEDVEVVKDNPT